MRVRREGTLLHVPQSSVGLVGLPQSAEVIAQRSLLPRLIDQGPEPGRQLPLPLLRAGITRGDNHYGVRRQLLVEQAEPIA